MTKERQNDNILPRKISEYIFEKLLGSKILRPDEKVTRNGYKLQRQAILSSNKTHKNLNSQHPYQARRNIQGNGDFSPTCFGR